jgi:hypothetical protein
MGDYASRERDNQRWEESQKGHPMTEPKDADAEWLREHARTRSFATEWMLWSQETQERFNAIAARLEQSAPVEVVEGLVEALRLSITDMGLCQCDVCSRSNAALAAYEQWKAEHRKDSQ